MSEPPCLLIVEDDPGFQRQLRSACDGYRIAVADDRESALAAVRADAPAVVVLDLGLPPDPDGVGERFATIAAIRALRPDTKIVVVSGHGERAGARKAIGMGAWDVHARPVDIDTLGLVVARAFHVHALEAENRRLATGPGAPGGMLTAAPEMLKVARTIERVAPADVSVMLLGAPGTGKELLARGLHDASPRRGGAFVAIHCAAVPGTLLERELFGHAEGALTGAIGTTPGKIERAAGGTLFLDEIGDVPLAVQGKLLRFLEERAIGRIGGRQAIAVDARIVCATHRDMDAMVADGRFRDDLYHRLAEVVVRIPPLAARTGDAVLLARAFLDRQVRQMGLTARRFAPDALSAIDAWRWPGNVRELEKRVKRAAIMADGKYITAADLGLGGGDDGSLNLKAAREAADRIAIARALVRAAGNISGAARLLGISRPTLYDLMKAYDLHP